MAELIVRIVQLRSVGRNPRQRHTAAVTAFGAGGTGGAPCGRILQLIPRNVGHFEQAEFLALIHVAEPGSAISIMIAARARLVPSARSSRYVVPSRSSQSSGSRWYSPVGTWGSA